MLRREHNPKNRGKSNIKFLIRNLEDLLKNIFLILIIFISFFIKKKGKEKRLINLGNYIDIYSINYIVFSLSKRYTFTYNLSTALTLFKRLGFKSFLNNCGPNFLFKGKKIEVKYNAKKKLQDNEINFNFDYFKFFDENNFNEVNDRKSIIMPYYTRAEFYKSDYFNEFKNYRQNKKNFCILFSGSSHTDWYEQFKWPVTSNSEANILTRSEILNFIKNEYKNETQIIVNREQLNEIDYTKKILLFISDPSKKRKFSKILSMHEHMNFIGMSKFFLTCPGTTMPLSHHLVECMFLGTVPISSYGDLLFPKLLNNINSLTFKNYSQLNDCIEKSFSIDDKESNKMKSSVLEYYENNLSPESFLENFESNNLPFNLYMNVDGHSLDSRRERFGLPRLFPKPKS